MECIYCYHHFIQESQYILMMTATMLLFICIQYGIDNQYKTKQHRVVLREWLGNIKYMACDSDGFNNHYIEKSAFNFMLQSNGININFSYTTLIISILKLKVWLSMLKLFCCCRHSIIYNLG